MEDKFRKQSLYFPHSMLGEITEEAKRLDRSMSWLMQFAWKLAQKQIKGWPAPSEVVPELRR